jgi:AcrR family transcriptional regulator
MPERVVSTRRRRRPTASGTVLSQGLIVETAIRLVGEHGAEGLSVRRLGAALGSDPSAIYRYFQNTDDLVRAVADELIGRCLSDFAVGPDWRETLRELGIRVHTAMLSQPRAAVLTAARVTGRPNEIRTVELGLGVLGSAGFGPAEAARLYHGFIDFTLGYAALDAAAAALPRGGEENDDSTWATIYAKLPGAEYPHIAASAAALAETMTASAYPGALAVYLDGIAARVPA